MPLTVVNQDAPPTGVCAVADGKVIAVVHHNAAEAGVSARSDSVLEEAGTNTITDASYRGGD